MSSQSLENKYSPPQRCWTKKEWLYEQYWGEVNTIEEMAEKADVSRTTVMRSMRKLGVPRRPRDTRCETVEDVVRAYRRKVSTDGGIDVEWGDVCGVEN